MLPYRHTSQHYPSQDSAAPFTAETQSAGTGPCSTQSLVATYGTPPKGRSGKPSTLEEDRTRELDARSWH
ncbi:hypothetical protein Y1Q_0007433 [Alligator mississippiensis]|uniref:Uncharacterized protein n=1 Tax=Alligator mississippiensis TaxID=8496 RepID=A0A151P7X5_ALLMI|nr:hypothetical protein Y1Q_0007433 [Alligator mississippiensis]